MGYKKRMSFCQQNVPKADTWQHTLRTKSARVVQIAGVRKRKGYNVFCVRRVRIAPVPPRRVWGGNTRISGKVVWGQRDGEYLFMKSGLKAKINAKNPAFKIRCKFFF